MKIFINCIMLFCMVQFFTSCSAQKSCVNCGLVVIKARFFDSTSGRYIPIPQFRDKTMWYKDSIVIQEVSHIYQNEDIYHNITWKVLVDRYKYIDMRTKSIYEYYSFSDTAKLIKRCAPNDTICISECWVYRPKNDFMPNVPYINLPDTVINSVNYKRIKAIQLLDTEKGKVEFAIIGYLRCDKKDGIFLFSKDFSRKIGCQLTRFEENYTPSVYPADNGEIDYLPRKLNDQELKVFAAWEKNAKK
jgi:hypothetical protein